MRALVASLCATVLIAGTAAANASGKVAPPPPPFAGAYQPRGVDEIGLWREQDEEEKLLSNSPILIRDERLNAYLRKVLCTAVGSDRCGAVRIYVLRTPLFNATMSPNGTMRVFSGLLLRVRDEAELASVLGHEFGHFEQRHSLSRFKTQRSGTDMLSWAAVLAGMSGSSDAMRSFNDVQLSVYGSLFRYGRDQEREADRFGIGYLNASSYRPQAAAAIWRNIMAETEASALARGLKKPKLDTIAFFASHPPTAERAATLAELASPDGATRDTGADRYAAAINPWLPQFLDDQIKLNDFGASEYLISALGERGWTAALWQARGDLYRGRGNPRDLVNAADFYGRAVALDPALPEAHRGLGMAYIKTGRGTEGRAALRRYLELRPKSQDAEMIGMLIGTTGDAQ